MIKDFIAKVSRLFQFNRVLQLKLVVCIVLAIVARLFCGMIINLDKAVTRVNAQWALVTQIPSMEKKLRTQNLKLLKPENQIIAIRTILEGTSFRDNVYQAIIDGEIYSTGDMIGDYKIINITLKTIMLENSKMFEIKELSFPENSGIQPEL